MFCRYCGKELPSDSRFCPDCGKAVSVEDGTANGTTIENRAPGAKPSSAIAAAETLSVDCCYKAPGFLMADRIPGTLTLTGENLSFRQWGSRMINSVLTLGLMSYSKGQGIEWPLADIRSATFKRGWRNATLSICGQDGRRFDFEISKSPKLERFYEQLLGGIRS